MIEGEQWIANQISNGVNFKDIFSLCNSLELKVCIKSLPSSIESSLHPSQNNDCLGLISINKTVDLDKDVYPLLHCVIRYLLTYGPGERVTKRQACARAISRKSIDEQYIDYICYAIIMPWHDVAQDIIEFQKIYPHVNELEYVAMCGQKYGETIVSARKSQFFHRMRQVISLVKNPSFSSDPRMYYSSMVQE